MHGQRPIIVQRGKKYILYAHTVLYKPFVDCFGGMRHEDSAFEIGFGEDVGNGGRMIQVETIRFISSIQPVRLKVMRSRGNRDGGGDSPGECAQI